MNYEIGLYLREQRHLFGICPDCGQISRLTDIRISYRTKYAPDWMDKIERQLNYWADKTTAFDEEKSQKHAKAIEKARRILLPKKLKELFPLMAAKGIGPDDVKVILNPIDFIGFEGMNTAGSLRKIVVLESRSNSSFRREVQQSVQKAVDNAKYDWNTLRVDDKGIVSSE